MENLLDENKCQCGAEGVEEHTCPYAEELHNDCSLCNCCDECAQQCAWDI